MLASISKHLTCEDGDTLRRAETIKFYHSSLPTEKSTLLNVKIKKKTGNESSDTEKRFAEIGEAYDVLTDPKVKVLYDQFGEGIKNGVPVPPGPFEPEGPIEIYAFHGDPIKVFRDFFGVDNPFADFYLPNLDPSYKFYEQRAKPIPGPDQEHSFPLTLKDAFYGCTKTVQLPLQVAGENNTETVSVVKDFTFRIPKEYPSKVKECQYWV